MTLRDIFVSSANALKSGDHGAVDRMMNAARLEDPHKEFQMAQWLADHYRDHNIPLNNEVRARLATRLAKDGVEAMAEEDRERVFFLISGCDLEGLMGSIDNTLKKHLYPGLGQSEKFADASTDWDTWDQNDKQKYGEYFAMRFAYVAGTPRAEVHVFERERDERGVAMGYCQRQRSGRCRIGINAVAGGAMDSKKAFDETMYHELIHTVHYDLSQCANTGNFRHISPSLRTPATLLSLLCHPDFYARLSTQQLYESYPIERHAENSAKDFARVMHDPAALAEAVKQDTQYRNAATLFRPIQQRL